MISEPTRALAEPEPEPPQPAAAEPLQIRMPVDVRSAALTVLTVLAVILVLQYAQAVIIPIVLGVLISYALEPVVAFLVRHRVPRPIGSALVTVAVVMAVGGLAYGLRSEVTDLLEQLPQAAKHLRQSLEGSKPTSDSGFQQVQKAATELERAANAASTQAPAPPGVQRVQVQAPPIDITSYVFWGSLGVLTAAGQMMLILFLAFFLLASGDMYRRKIVKIVGPSLSKKKITLHILSEIDRQIERFLIVQLSTSALVAVVSWLAFRYIGLEQAAVWGILAGLFNSIPYFGPVLVTGGTSLVAYMQFGNIRMAAIVGIVALLITSVEGLLLTPYLTSRAARMNAVAIFVNLLFWGWVWNVWGMLLAVPMLMVIKAVCDHVEELNGFGELLGE